MTMYTLKATLEESDAIAKGDKAFIFRADSMPCGVGDEITFQSMKNGKMTRHPIERMKFRVTYISTDAPIDRGFKVIGFRQIQ